MHKLNRFFRGLLLAFIATGFLSCKKLVEIPEQSSTIVTPKVFSSDEVAAQAVSGIYYKMVNSRESLLTCGGMTIYAGLYADELVPFSQTNNNLLQFYHSSLTPDNNLLPRLWNSPYSIIYQANAVLEGINNSSMLSDSAKNGLVAETKFLRAFTYFNLVNLFGDIPIVRSTDWRETGSLGRRPVSEVYQFILSDLKDAEPALRDDYHLAKGERIIPNKSAAKALLARVYLFLGEWAHAETEANAVINSGMYILEPQLNDVFKPSSKEAIFQLKHDNSWLTLTATSEGAALVPTSVPFASLTRELLDTFDSTDNRKDSWINSITTRGKTYFYPYKYKIGRLQAVADGPYSEYYMVLRLAEQYLIRAESRARQNKPIEAIADLNMIRERANAPSLPDSLTSEEIINAVAQERRLELFVEWGHRWLDLKRTGKADEVLGVLKQGFWKPTGQLFPLPYSELTKGPNLTQNEGYF